jgi:hypothetical protein
MLIRLILSCTLLFALNTGAATLLPIFDSHLHYSHDAWEQLPPKEAIAILRQAGLQGAMVSSSSDDGAQMLLAEAPDLVIPVLRPYRQRGEGWPTCLSKWPNASPTRMARRCSVPC